MHGQWWWDTKIMKSKLYRKYRCFLVINYKTLKNTSKRKQLLVISGINLSITIALKQHKSAKNISYQNFFVGAFSLTFFTSSELWLKLYLLIGLCRFLPTGLLVRFYWSVISYILRQLINKSIGNNALLHFSCNSVSRLNRELYF